METKMYGLVFAKDYQSHGYSLDELFNLAFEARKQNCSIDELVGDSRVTLEIICQLVETVIENNYSRNRLNNYIETMKLINTLSDMDKDI